MCNFRSILVIILIAACCGSGFGVVLCRTSDGVVTLEFSVHDKCGCSGHDTQTDESQGSKVISRDHRHCEDTYIASNYTVLDKENFKTVSLFFIQMQAYCSDTQDAFKDVLFDASISYFTPLKTIILIV